MAADFQAVSADFQAVRGMADVLPAQSVYWDFLKSKICQLMQCYAYAEIQFPILENTALFKRAVGETTDIVEKEMYTFADRNGDSLSLRPEGTAGCVRAGNQHGLFYNQIQKLWYQGYMFRHERPQKGRLRQFYQLGVEAFGLLGPDIDAEQILMAKKLWELLGIDQAIQLEINSLGTKETRAAYREILAAYFRRYFNDLDEDSKRRLETNPLRILDSKNPVLAEMIQQAPKLVDHLDEASKQHFAALLAILDQAGLAYQINPHLVRGLDYYGKTVYEWKTTLLGAQGTVCAGGRYDSLVEILGGKSTPAVGFAMGFERVIALLETLNPQLAKPIDIFLIATGDQARAAAILLAERIHRLSNCSVMTNCSDVSLKNQFKRADKLNATCAFVLGEKELETGTVSVKYLRERDQAQQVIPLTVLEQWLANFNERSNDGRTRSI